MEWWGLVLVALAMAVGLVGTVVPGMPGLAVIWGAGLVYGLVEGLDTVGWVAFGGMSVLAVIGQLASYLLPTGAAAGRGASRSSIMLGALLAIVGFFLIPVVGLVVGGALGVLLGEQRRHGDPARAWEVTKAVLVGFGLGALAELAAGLAMVVTWVIWVLAGP